MRKAYLEDLKDQQYAEKVKDEQEELRELLSKKDKKHTDGPWFIEENATQINEADVDGEGWTSKTFCIRKEKLGKKICEMSAWSWQNPVSYLSDPQEVKANAKLIAAAPDLEAVASNFEITGPDADGLVWLVLHGNGTTGKAAFSLGSSENVAGKVALFLEDDRRAALFKARGGL